MRIKLELQLLKTGAGTTLPCNYQYELSAVIYRILNEGDPAFTAWLHDSGYLVAGRKQFKLFTFSNLYIPRFRIVGDRLNVLADRAQLIVSFYPIDAMEKFIMGLFQNRRFFLGDRLSGVDFEVVSVEKLSDPEFTAVMRFKTLSPVFIEEQLPDRTNHLSPVDPAFSRLLHLNLSDKFRAFYGVEPDPAWPETQFRLLSDPKPKTITIKAGTPQETRQKGYMCQFQLTGAPELLRIGYFAGYGRANSQGFGCIETIKSNL